MSRRFQFSLRTVSYGAWLRRVIAWDGLLPIGFVFLPYMVEVLFPNRRSIMEAIAVVLPIVAFFYRVHNGIAQIASNRCSPATQRLQYCVFCVGILPLILIDCVLILSHLMPPGTLFQAHSDRIVWTVLFGIYLAAMIVAMYPGQAEAEDEWESRFNAVQAELEQPPCRGL